MNDNEATMRSRVTFPKFWVGFFFVAVSLLVWLFWPIKIVERMDLGHNPEYGFLQRYVDVTPLHTYLAYHFVVLSVLTGWAYWLHGIRRLHDVMAKATDGRHPVSPKRAVWPHLIPFYNLYWAFRWPEEIAHSIYQRSYQLMSDKVYGVVLLVALLAQYTIVIDVLYLMPTAREAMQTAYGLSPLGLLNLAVILRAVALTAAILVGMTVSKAIGRMITAPDDNKLTPSQG